jgi:3-oxoacyl-[acyl-carrier protein] reductase
MDFSAKKVLVTGASRGIGRAIAVQFAERGAQVAVHYGRNEDAANETIKMLDGDGHITVKAELSNPDEVKRMVDDTVAGLGGLDILVNNAGVYEEHPVLDTDYDTWQAQWEKIISINLFGAANAIYCAVNYMKDNGGGRIVNISSRGAFRGEPTAPAYGASKAGMNSMGQSLAKALAPHNVFIGTVAPGFVQTDMARDLLQGESGEAIRAQSPLNRVAMPDEVAFATLFLAAEGSQFMTGTIIDVNGASYLRS